MSRFELLNEIRTPKGVKPVDVKKLRKILQELNILIRQARDLEKDIESLGKRAEKEVPDVLTSQTTKGFNLAIDAADNVAEGLMRARRNI